MQQMQALKERGKWLSAIMARPLRMQNDGGWYHVINRGIEKVNRERGNKREIRRRWTFPEVVNAVETARGESWEQFAQRHGDYGRDVVLCMARENTGLTLRELGEAVGGMDYEAVGEAVRRLRKRLKEDRSIRKVYKHAVQITNLDLTPIPII